jgi:uncharacterized cofD-like protein
MQKLKAVVMGGGNGVAKTTRALKENLDVFEISSVVAMSDSGGSSGRLRKEFDVLPPGDILRAALALSVYDYKILKTMFRGVRFSNTGKLDNHNLGNLFLVLAEKYGGSLLDSIRALEQAVQATGHTYPATLDSTDLIAELTNGDIIKTEGVIDRPEYDRNLRIKKVWLEPTGEVYKDAKQKIEEADCILLGPGSLYCSVIASLLPNGVKEAINKSKAKLIYLAGNTYEEIGETGPVKLSEFITELENYLPRKLDYIIYNQAELNNEQTEKHKSRKWGLKELDLENLEGREVLVKDYEKSYGGLDEVKLGKIIKDIMSESI